MLGEKFGRVDGKIKHYADMILLASQRAANLTAQLLAFARRGKFNLTAVNLHKTIGDTVQLLEHSIEKTITIGLRLDARNPVVRGDPSQLQNALINLAINARDAMPDGGKILISTETIDIGAGDGRLHALKLNTGPYICLSVTDTGTGMDDETKSRIFEPFFTTKAPGKGTGLGLAGVYGTITNHHGAIDVVSELYKGTSFNWSRRDTRSTPIPEASCRRARGAFCRNRSIRKGSGKR